MPKINNLLLNATKIFVVRIETEPGNVRTVSGEDSPELNFCWICSKWAGDTCILILECHIQHFIFIDEYWLNAATFYDFRIFSRKCTYATELLTLSDTNKLLVIDSDIRSLDFYVKAVSGKLEITYINIKKRFRK